METMMVDKFTICSDPNNGLDYVCMVKDELKNHRDVDKGISVEFMPENLTNHWCPVRSFKMHFEHLNPANKYLWQTPLQNIQDENQTQVWYSKGHIGKNPLATFLSTMSKTCELSQIYTNHSTRVTGATVLGRMNFSPKQIMSVTGHKSV